MRCINPEKFKLNHHDLDRYSSLRQNLFWSFCQPQTSSLDQNILSKVILASKLHQNILLKVNFMSSSKYPVKRFHRSEWSDPGAFSTWYVIYRWEKIKEKSRYFLLFFFFVKSCFGCTDGCGGCGSCLSEHPEPKMVDLHDRPGHILPKVLGKVISRASPC